MSEAATISEIPESDEMFLIAGWKQWADAGSISSGLPQYLIRHTKARKIGSISSDSYYIFQIPGTHDLVRPIVKFKEGYPEYLESIQNDFYYTGDKKKGLVIFLGYEPHMDIERYINTFLEAVDILKIRRIIGLGGVFGELPYDKARLITSIYSQPQIKKELKTLAVNLSEYHGGASIGSYLCRRAAERGIEYVSFYGFVPAYDFPEGAEGIDGISIEQDFTAWLGIMQRINHMLEMELDLSELEKKSEHLIKLMDKRIDEIERTNPQLNIQKYLQQLRDNYNENLFQPLDDFWENELGWLFEK